jgi:hypothetical protein
MALIPSFPVVFCSSYFSSCVFTDNIPTKTTTNAIFNVQPRKTKRSDFYMDRIAESGDRCVDVWQEHIKEAGIDGRGTRADSSSSAIEEGGVVDIALTRTVTIGTGVNSGIEKMVAEGRDCSVLELENILKNAGVFGDVRVQAALLMEAYDKSQSGFLSRDELSSLLHQIASDARGAPFWRQVLMAHNRSLKQQLNKPVSIIIELGTVSLAVNIFY